MGELHLVSEHVCGMLCRDLNIVIYIDYGIIDKNTQILFSICTLIHLYLQYT